MNILAITGSPKEESSSKTLLQCFLEGAKGHEVRIIDAYHPMVSPCVACGACSKEPRLCVQQDQMQQYYQDLAWADVIVVATPMYYNSVPAPLKAFVDRTMCLFATRFYHGEKADKKRKGYLLLTCGSFDMKAVACVESQIKQMFDVCWAKFAELKVAVNMDKVSNFDKIKEDAYLLGKSL